MENTVIQHSLHF